jgi:hypothetical protein
MLRMSSGIGSKRRVCFGISEIRTAEPRTWLGGDQYARQAATLAAPFPKLGERRAIYELIFDINGKSLPGLAKCLADLLGVPPRKVPRILEPFIEFTDALELDTFTARTFPVNFGVLSHIRRNEIDARDLLSPSSRPIEFDNKIVILGYKDPTDTITIPGETEAVYGMEAQGASVYTLLNHPLYSLTPLGNLIVDLVLAVMFLAIVHSSALRGHGSDATKEVSRSVTSAAGKVAMRLAASVIVASVVLSWAGLFMPDVFPIALGAYIHPYAERVLGVVLKRILPWLFLLVCSSGIAFGEVVDLPQAQVIESHGRVSLITQSKESVSIRAGAELRAGEVLNCRNGAARIEVYGLWVNGRPLRIRCSGIAFAVPRREPLVTPTLVTLTSKFRILGRR